MHDTGRADLELRPVEERDLETCSDVFLSAFATDAIMTLLRPPHLARSEPDFTQADRLRHHARGLKHYFDDAQKDMLKAVDPSSPDEVLGFAIWARPGCPIRPPKDDAHADDEKDPEEDPAAVEHFVEELMRRREQVMGDKPHWYLQYLVVRPTAQGRGVGGALLAYGLNKADGTSLPAVLESSVPGRPIYEKKGFAQKGECTVWARTADGTKIEGSDVRFPVMVREPRGSSA